jgi:branched-chain amino acid transport system permease protein
LVNGVSVGAIYAMIALGYTMVYGVLKLINFAHGDVFMIGAMMGYYASGALHLRDRPSVWGALAVTLFAMIVCGLLGLAIERLAYRPLRNAPRINSLITAIGVSFLLEYGGQYLFGPNPRRFLPLLLGEQPEGLLPHKPVLQIHGVSLGYIDLVCILVSVALMFILQRVVFHTRIGTAMRAVSWNPDVAGLMGVNTDFVISFTFVLGSVLAAAAGILYASKYPSVHPLMGLMPGLKAFVAAVLGGIGNVPGAMLGGLLLGLAEQFVAGYGNSSWRDAVAFSILILILLAKPSGLLGRTAAEKV